MKIKATKKLLSLLLVAVMLLGAFPVGIISVSAVVEEGPLTVDLTTYDTANEFVINSITDWKTIANSGKDFAGKTVKLGANIGGASASERATLPTLFATFAGTFDGATYAIQYADVTGSALIAAKAETSVMNNVTVNDCNVDAGVATGDVGVLVGFVAETAKLTVNNCSVNATVKGGANMGILIGNLANKSVLETNIDSETSKIQVSGKLIPTNTVANMGGVVGLASASSEAKLTRIDVDGLSAESIDTANQKYLGGLIGQAAGADHLILVTDCSVKNVTVAGFKSVFGGAIGIVAGSNTSNLTHADEDYNIVVNGFALNEIDVTTTGSLGGVIGWVEMPKGETSYGVAIQNITLSETVNLNNGSAGYLGGLIGRLFMNSTNSSLLIDDVTVAGDVTVHTTGELASFGVGFTSIATDVASLTVTDVTVLETASLSIKSSKNAGGLFTRLYEKAPVIQIKISCCKI